MRRIVFSIFLALVIISNTACSQMLGKFITPFHGDSTSTILTIDQVRESDGLGQFTLSGKADFPEQTQITISAIRRLTFPSNDKTSNADRFYSILDRKTTLVKDGYWKAKLSLWEVNSEGYYQENWQANEAYPSDKISSNPTVNFLLTIEPKNFIDYTTNSNNSNFRKLDDQSNDLIRFTPEGESYLSVSKDLVIPLPQKVKAPRVESAQTPDTGWQKRTLLDPTKSSIEKPSQLPFLNEDNLPLTSDNLMK